MVTLYVDADSCPKQLRTIVLRAVVRLKLPTYFVADRKLQDVLSAYQEHTAHLRKEARASGIVEEDALRSIRSPISMIVVSSDMNSADDWIVEHSSLPAVAITHDIPLAARLVEKGLTVLDDRGGIFTAANIAERLSIRNAMAGLREMGVFVEQHQMMNAKQVKAFADAFDSVLTSMLKQHGTA